MPSPTGDAGDVLVHAAGSDLQLRADRPVRVLDVEVRAESRAAAEHRVEIERRESACWATSAGFAVPPVGGLIEGDVVIGELADERRAGGHGRVVRVGAVGVSGGRVAVDGRIDDQRLRPRRQLDPRRP